MYADRGKTYGSEDKYRDHDYRIREPERNSPGTGKDRCRRPAVPGGARRNLPVQPFIGAGPLAHRISSILTIGDKKVANGSFLLEIVRVVWLVY